jgi:hypothetical protein
MRVRSVTGCRPIAPAATRTASVRWITPGRSGVTQLEGAMIKATSFGVLVLGALIGQLGTPPDAMAQPDGASTSAQAGATIVAAMGIVTNPVELSFGSVMASASTAGILKQTAAARPARTGIGVALSSDAAVSAATFSVTGDGSATYAIMLPSGPETATHAGCADEVTFTPFSSLPGGTGLLGAAGTQTIYVGGTLNVAKSQRPGVYTGTFNLTVAYN